VAASGRHLLNITSKPATGRTNVKIPTPTYYSPLPAGPEEAPQFFAVKFVIKWPSIGFVYMDRAMHANGASSSDRFLTLLKPIERDLETYCRRLIWVPEEAADAIQNAVLRAYSAFGRYREDASFKAWMFKILTNEAFALNRKHARIAQHEIPVDPVDLAEIPAEDTETDEDRKRGLTSDDLNELVEADVAAGLKKLTETERAVLLLRSIGELRYREIAESLDMPIGSVMGNLARARQKMRAALKRSRKGDAYIV
jgi:RNA polymerase sigma-70 factor (ECF subfamily)